jgi:hypothetical protein
MRGPAYVYMRGKIPWVTCIITKTLLWCIIIFDIKDYIIYLWFCIWFYFSHLWLEANIAFIIL